MPRPFSSTFLGFVAAALSCAAGAPAQPTPPIAYDIVYVRQARFGDNSNTTWPEVFHPAAIDPGADLMLLHPDGSEEVLVAGGNGAITDPFVSLDAQWVYYSRFPDMRSSAINSQRGLPYQGADIYRIHLGTRQIERLTHQEFTPNTGAGNWDESNPVNPPGQFNRLGYGILNLGPCPLPGGRIAFTSNRNGYVPPKNFTNPTLQLFVMDEDGSNVECIAPMNIGSALHPVPLMDGRIMFSTYESQGLRDARLWGIWAINPDGREWSPIVSAFNPAQAFHFQTQLSGGDLVVIDYYNLNNNGFGGLYRLPLDPPAGQPRFYSAFASQHPPIQQTIGAGFLWPLRFPFMPRGIHSLSPFTTGQDEAAPIGPGGVRVGKFTHPSGAPAGDLLVVWSPGPANDLNRPTPVPYYDAGIYLVPGGGVMSGPADLILIKNDPLYNEAWPRAVVPYSAIYGIAQPQELPFLPNDGSVHQELPEGTPLGLVGSSSLYKRESFPGLVSQWSNTFNGLDVFNTLENDQSSNWGTQGSDAGRYSNSDIWAVRILAMEPNTHRSYGPQEGQQYRSHANERLRILGEIPVRKQNPDGTTVLDPEGAPDTSFLVKIPADTPFTFQTLDRFGTALNTSQTWHQVRPGEMRANCGGCHAHSQQPLSFESTAAGQPGFPVTDLSTSTPLLTRDGAGTPGVRIVPGGVVDVEFLRDIRPILQGHCVQCHTSADPTPPSNLVLDDTALYGGLPGDYARLADDDGARWGHPSVIRLGGQPVWRQTNASRYVRAFQSRRSLLTWKIFGQRMDGWTNASHPTESVPGNPATLPPGADPNAADLDFTGTIMPPPDGGVPPLSEDQKMTIARWIDLGCPINTGQLSSPAAGARGWFLDDLKPTLTISEPARGVNSGAIDRILIGASDANSGINAATLSIRASFPVEGRAPGAELADLAQPGAPGVWSIPLGPPLTDLPDGHVLASVRDNAGNILRIDRRFSVAADARCPADFNGDGVLDPDDLSAFITCFFLDVLSPGACSEADFNGDGRRDPDDLSELITGFFLGCP